VTRFAFSPLWRSPGAAVISDQVAKAVEVTRSAINKTVTARDAVKRRAVGSISLLDRLRGDALNLHAIDLSISKLHFHKCREERGSVRSATLRDAIAI
jgi:hypothetical protein